MTKQTTIVVTGSLRVNDFLTFVSVMKRICQFDVKNILTICTAVINVIMKVKFLGNYRSELKNSGWITIG